MARNGYGQGLSIVQGIVRLLHPRIDVKSEVGGSSTFSIALPSGELLTEAVHPAGSGERQRGPRESQPHIPLIGDDVAVRTAMQMLPLGPGYRVSTVASLAEAVGRIAEGRTSTTSCPICSRWTTRAVARR